MSEKRVQKFYRRKHLREVSGYCESHVYKLISEGKFPAPIKISGRSSAWTEEDILKWQRERIEASKADV